LRPLRDERGSAIVETALVLALVGLPVLLGTAEVGTWLYSSIEIANAAHAGALYGMTSSAQAISTSAIQSAAQAEAPDFGTNLSVTSSVYYVCSASEGGIQYTSQTAANTACPSNATNHYVQFLKVTASATVSSLVTCPGLPSSISVVRSSVMEVEE
jgi:Flp pilus assembly protein TadG